MLIARILRLTFGATGGGRATGLRGTKTKRQALLECRV